MMVTFVSQCEKNALKKTRRVLDAFANRIGDNTWQTVITEEGLLTVKKMLRKTASKNTAVSCHWIRSRSRSHFLWVVGNKRKFDSEGRVPVNSTANKKYTGEKENRWQHAHSIQIVSVLAALLHDIGKATIGFQKKLTSNAAKASGDPYRHEWISLRLFQAMIYGCNDDESWLTRFVSFEKFLKTEPVWLERLCNDSNSRKQIGRSLENFPPLAQWVAWLVVTHHRLPTYAKEYWKQGVRQGERENSLLWGREMDVLGFYSYLHPYEGWVKNSRADERDQDFWTLKGIIVESGTWQKSLSRWARKALEHQPLRELATSHVSDPFLMHMSRLCLMLADHNYSSLLPEDKKRVSGDRRFAGTLLANTDKNRQPKQSLDEHLIGVAEFAKKIARDIPQLDSKIEGLPTRFSLLSKNTGVKDYKWQNDAFKLAHSVNRKSQELGFFGVNMASTGKGKTLANARIMYALANEERGARFTIALGLRVLTLQTGKALRERLNFTADQLAVLVGGAANKKLFELQESESNEISDVEILGSESLEALLDASDSVDSGILPDEFATLVADPTVRKLLYAPVVCCTIDHIIQATENSRGGKHIAPILRLLTSDLVLDEPDDFDQNDLPALARLVYFAGLFGSKVLLSSATLTPDLIAGLHTAYLEGRTIWNKQMGLPNSGSVCCAWFDEYAQISLECESNEIFLEAHKKFVKKRVQMLSQQAVRRRADFLPIQLPPPNENTDINYQALAKVILESAFELHLNHALRCPLTKKQISIGLVRLANVRPIINLVKAMFSLTVGDNNTHYHLCCYHAKQLLVLRNDIEQKLDRILSRSGPKIFFEHPEIRNILDNSDAQHHIFMVVASPVAEVGRDHDYDWAIIEPSSMRSIIQLAGRVWRHRPEKVAVTPNLLIWEKNIRAIKNEKPSYCRPGFEQAGSSVFSLKSHSCRELITLGQLDRVDAEARVSKATNLDPRNRLADLEHAVIADLVNNSNNYVSAFWRERNGNHLSAHLQKITPFRAGEAQEDFVCLPSQGSPHGFQFTFAESAWSDLENPVGQLGKFRFQDVQLASTTIQPWLHADLELVLSKLADKLEEEDLAVVARQYASVRLEKRDGIWNFHPWLGFWN